MRRIVCLGAQGLAVLAVLSAAASMAQAAAIEDYLRLPDVRMVRLSPDASKIALVAHSGPDAQIRVVGTDDRSAVFSAKLGSKSVSDLSWIDQGALLTISEVTSKPWGVQGGDIENFLAAVLDLKSGQGRPLAVGGETALNTILGVPTVIRKADGAKIFMEGVFFPDRYGVRALFRTSPQDLLVDRLEEGRRETTGFFVGASGEPAARTDYDPAAGEGSVWAKRGLSWRLIHKEAGLSASPRVLGYDRDGRSLLVRIWTAGVPSVHRAGLEDQTWSGPLADVSNRRVLFDPLTRIAIGTAHETADGETLAFFDPNDQKLWDMVLRAFPNARIGLTSWSDDRRRVIVRVEGAKTGASYFLVDALKGKADWLADVYRGLGAGDIADRRTIRYQASDGAELSAVLTASKASAGTGAALVVIARGAIGGGDAQAEDALAQALASKGYLVLQPRPRSQTIEASPEAPAARFREDLADGVQALVRSGAADPGKVCLVGLRYGGFAALSAVTVRSGPYRCAVGIEPLTDLRSYIAYIDDRSRHQALRAEQLWRRAAGAQSQSDPGFDAVSPLAHAASASSPILLAHPLRSVEIPYAQTAQMAAALKKAGKSVEILDIPSDDGFLGDDGPRLTALKGVVDFIQAHNPPSAQPQARADAPAPDPAARPVRQGG